LTELQLYQVDAFTDRVFSGNPAAVVPLERWLDERLMQRIANENNLAETAFFVPDDEGAGSFEIRWFTPMTEVPRSCDAGDRRRRRSSSAAGTLADPVQLGERAVAGGSRRRWFRTGFPCE
jgi:hypothetical protein